MDMLCVTEATLDRLLAMTDEGLDGEHEDDTLAWNVLLEVRRELLLLKQGRGELPLLRHAAPASPPPSPTPGGA